MKMDTLPTILRPEGSDAFTAEDVFDPFKTYLKHQASREDLLTHFYSQRID